MIGATTPVITNPSDPGATYTYTIATTAEATAVTSTAYTITASTSTSVTAATVTPTTTTAGATAGYTVAFNVGTAGRLDPNTAAGPNTIDIIFPAGTTLPASIAAANVTVNGTACTVAPTISGQTVTVSTPVAVASGGAVSIVISSAAGIVNPTTAGSYTLTVDTSAETTSITSNSYTITAAADTTPPTVTAFTMPATASSTTVSVTSFTATDNVAVTGYLINESATTPSVSDPNWSGTAPTSYTFSGTGTKTAYAWAKDAAGNISTSLSATVTITIADTTPPTVTAFTMPATASSTTVSVTSFTATDNIAVTGYLINENATTPSVSDPNWSGTAPTSYTFSGTGAKIAYAWAKDAAGNISASLSATVTITVSSGGGLSGFKMHNYSTAKSSGSTNNYWGTKGGWGVTGGVYGRFVCVTCHRPDAANIKAIQNKITSGQAGQGFPGKTVVYLNATSAGSMVEAGRASSLRVCEACHSQTKHHRFSVSTNYTNWNGGGGNGTATQSDTTPHYYGASQVCVSCHSHDKGFMASCDTCHGLPPTLTSIGGPNGLANPATNALGTSPTNPGAHNAHYNTMGIACDACHKNNLATGHNTTSILMGFSLGNATWSRLVNTITTFSTYSGNNTTAGYTAKPAGNSYPTSTIVGNKASTDNSCNTYCHANWANGGGTVVRPRWAVPTDGACGTCHFIQGTVPASGATGNHSKHAGTLSSTNYGYKCNTCHNNVTDTTQHVQGQVSISFDNLTTPAVGTASASYRGTTALQPAKATSASFAGITGNYGTCTNLYCHSTAQGSTGTSTGITYASPPWGGGSISCGGCHADMSGASGTGDHVKHASTYGFACANCHGSGYTSTTIATATHVNRNIDLDFSAGTIAPSTSYSKTNSFAAGSAVYGNCTNSYCHSNGQSDNAKAAIYRQPVWGTTVTNCGSCHNNMATFANATSGSHLKHANTTSGYGFSCAVCHGAAYSATTVPTGAGTTHVNKLINLGFTGTAAGTTYGKGTAFAPASGAYNACTTSYCHSNGQSDNAKAAITRSVTWGAAAMTCGSCHNNMKTFANASSGSHKLHAQTANYDCAQCHAGYTATTVNTATHVDKKINLGFAAIGTQGTPVYSKYSAAGFAPAKGYYGVCSTTVCHGAGKPTWGNDTTRPECFKCHGSTVASFTNFSAASVAPGYNSEGRDTGGNTAATAPRVGTHQAHLTVADSITDKVYCGDCHTVHTAVTDATHLNYTTATVTFGPGAKLNGATPTDTRTSGIISCSTVYCHGGKMPGGDTSGTGRTPAWNNANYLPATLTVPSSCNSCHGFPPPTTAGHPAATAPASLPFGTNCNCHTNVSQTATTYAGIFVDKSKHINGTVEASGHSVPYQHYNLAAALAPATNCSCHTVSGGTYPNGTPNQYSAPNCQGCHTKAVPSTTSSTQCSDCHGDATTGRPNGGTAFPNWSGSHTTHVVAQSMACSWCHSGYGTGDIQHGFRNHTTTTRTATNGGVNMLADGTNATFTYAPATMTCTTVSCHGDAVWSVTTFDCISCHSSTITSTKGLGTIRAAATELGSGSSFKSHHVTGGAVTKWQCIICHAEGDTSTGSTTSLHKTGAVYLRNVDNPGNPGTAGTNYYKVETSGVWSTTDYTSLDNFCMGCHDSVGSASIAYNGTSVITTGLTATQQQKPFNDTLTNSYDGVARSRVLDVSTQFTTTNYSHHAVRGAKYSTGGKLKFNASVTLLNGTTLNDNSQLHCHDCHALNGHGTSGNEYILQSSGDATGATLHAAGTYVCLKCHVAATYSTTTHTAGNGSDFVNGRTGNYNKTGISCVACHNCGGMMWGGIHGGNFTYTPASATPGWTTSGSTGAGQSTYRFMPGMNNNGYSPANWTAASASIGCYTNPNASFGACTKHAGGTSVNLTRSSGARALSY